nr:type II toxin-antitoxin system RelE/ParE family toxin [Halomicroarcula sp. S1AR25-4]
MSREAVVEIMDRDESADDEWTWKLTTRAADQFDSLDPRVQDRIVSKLDAIVASEWREPDDCLEPPTGGPFSKLRVGPYRPARTLGWGGSMSRISAAQILGS